jgi:integrase/recombinase XerD
MAKKIKLNLRDEYNNQYLDAVFGDFIEEKKALGKSADTIKGYETTYRKFKNFFGATADMTGDITGSMVIEWISEMRDEGLADASINHHISCLRAFFYWCMEDDKKYLDYFKIKLVSVREEKPKDYTLDEVKSLLMKPRDSKSFAVWRTWAMVNFIMGTGARVGTLIDIQMRDLDLRNGKVFYRHTKNRKLQVVNLPPQLVNVLHEYISKCRYDAGEDDYLFCSDRGDKTTGNVVYVAYTRYARDRGVSKTTLHGLRHTFSREWYLNGGDIVQLSKVLGHSSLAMSEHYMNIYADSARDKFIEHNPLEHINRGKNRKTIKTKGKG